MNNFDTNDVYKMIENDEDIRKIEMCLFEYFINSSMFDPELQFMNSLLKEKGIKTDKIFLSLLYQMFSIKAIKDKYNQFYPEIDAKIVNDSIERAIFCYDKIIKKTNLLAKELNLKSSLDVSLLFTYMLYNGIFSYNSRHFYSENDKLKIPGHFSFDIFHGSGVCLNYSDMLSDILIDAGYDASIINNKVCENIKYDYIPNIKREIRKTSFLNKMFSFVSIPLSNKIGNHSCTLIFEEDKPYVFDPTNVTIFECLNQDEAINSIGKGRIRLMPYISTFLGNNDINFHTIKKFCLVDNYISPYNKDDFIFSIENVRRIIENEEVLFNDFHDDILNDVNVIVEKTKLLQKK